MEKGVPNVNVEPVAPYPAKDIVHEVKNVFIYIPAELSATGFELKINGFVRIVKKESDNLLVWDPLELSYQDVACLFSSESDGWTIIDEPYEVPVIVDEHECTYPSIYPKLDLKPPDPILPTAATATSPTRNNKNGGSKGSPSVRYKVGNEGEQKVGGAKGGSSPVIASSKTSPVSFSLSQLKMVRETNRREGTRLTFFLKDGKELPTLSFHDGGTAGLLQSMQRFLYLVRDGKDNRIIRVEKNPVVEMSRKKTPPPSGHKPHLPYHITLSGRGSSFPRALVQDLGKIVRNTFLPPDSEQLLERRPVETNDEEEEISTITCKDIETGGNIAKSKPDVATPEQSLISDFQIVTNLQGQLPPRLPPRPRLPPLSREEWESYREIDGRVSKENEEKFRARVFAGSIDHSIRREVWKYLLGYFRFGATDIERMEEQKAKEREYEIMKKQWESFLPQQEANFARWRELRNLVEKDVIRTDRDVELFHSVSSPQLKQLQNILKTYIMYNMDLGYVQGMSDLLSVILAIMENEVDSFWCFVGLMDMIHDRFEITQEFMRLRIKQLRTLLKVSDPEFYKYLGEKDSNNLYLSFRWLLVDFKREFQFSDLMILWEVFWTLHLSPDYPLFFALAIIEKERNNMMDPKFDFSDIIAHINGLSKNLQLEELLEKAESICRQVGAVDHLPEELQPLVRQPLPPPFTFPSAK
ncbi:PREDICTED: TBC1 domain family member 15-like [Amphimedon queenslandica]|uniref:Rab-GAP TBC domain-containing protein n=1 Tax=Amphimedon queenslandica TaxID=400682 RepID=A0A1X7V9B7_AMPQE|nr:PREDICTED: TBC1 domain family member 15-like [Amphimedon queenslandica]XP_019850000.1 PREDICTED: TBC1 domain family member 15-like [Amphimedon queenslandica]XP_019850001.1 PREDICTED: TBC1 domain family member 15-like [Amphimedon queenslandica]|eukprot:XP_019849999.1 PREDICTED: TBC1 domain family member 15-like [Amphimedon queenslandica]